MDSKYTAITLTTGYNNILYNYHDVIIMIVTCAALMEFVIVLEPYVMPEEVQALY